MSYRKGTCLLTTICLLAALYIDEAIGFEWPEWGSCPDLAVQQDFDVVNYQGMWWEQAGYNNERIEGKSRCVHAIYSITRPGSGVVHVENRGIDERTNRWGGINGTVIEADPSKNEGKLIVSFPVGLFGNVEGNYWVLGTDYNSYTVVYNCQNVLFFWRYWIRYSPRTRNEQASSEKQITSWKSVTLIRPQ
uniref:Lipocalin/cytosolic fatty-acid binding domain-containing protein n=1 Tax=Graphocephala atropunctata TaxID=36148 RepID=A0A1B6MRI9_9HEMI